MIKKFPFSFSFLLPVVCDPSVVHLSTGVAGVADMHEMAWSLQLEWAVIAAGVENAVRSVSKCRLSVLPLQTIGSTNVLVTGWGNSVAPAGSCREKKQ